MFGSGNGRGGAAAKTNRHGSGGEDDFARSEFAHDADNRPALGLGGGDVITTMIDHGGEPRQRTWRVPRQTGRLKAVGPLPNRERRLCCFYDGESLSKSEGMNRQICVGKRAQHGWLMKGKLRATDKPPLPVPLSTSPEEREKTQKISFHEPAVRAQGLKSDFRPGSSGQAGASPYHAHRRVGGPLAGWDTCDTADLEVCATKEWDPRLHKIWQTKANLWQATATGEMFCSHP